MGAVPELETQYLARPLSISLAKADCRTLPGIPRDTVAGDL